MWERKPGKNSTTDSEFPCRWVMGAWNCCWVFRCCCCVFLFLLIAYISWSAAYCWRVTSDSPHDKCAWSSLSLSNQLFFSCNHYLLILFTPLFTPLFHGVHAIDTRLKFVTIKAFYRLYFMLSIPSFMISLWAHLNDVYLCFRNLLVPCESVVKVG